MSEDNKNICEFCNKNFTTVATLKAHLKNSKKCILLRDNNQIEVNSFPCTYCKRIFTQKIVATNHMNICKLKTVIDEIKIDESVKNIEELKTEIRLKDEQIKFKDELLKEKDNQLKEKDNQLEKQIKEKDIYFEKLLKEKDTHFEKLLKEKDIFIKDLIDKYTSANTTVYQTNDNRTNINYNNMKAEMINKLVPFTDENITNMVSNINPEMLIYFNDFDAEKSFVSEFIKAVKTLAFCVDPSRGKLVVKNESGETNTLLVNTFLLTIINKTKKQLLNTIRNAYIFLKAEYENGEMTLEDFSNCSYKLDIIKTHLNQNGSNEFLIYLGNTLVKGLEVLPSKAAYKLLNTETIINKTPLLNKMD